MFRKLNFIITFFAVILIIVAVIAVVFGGKFTAYAVSPEFIDTVVDHPVRVTGHMFEYIPESEYIYNTTNEESAGETLYSEDDVYNLAAAVCREAGNASEEIQLLVANVVINRVNSPLYPDTIEGVLTQKKQYGTMWKNGISFPKWADEDTIERCKGIATRILDGERVCPENVLFQAEFKQGTGVYKEFDGYYFCYID